MPTNRNLNQRIKAALYELKKQYGGGPLWVYTNNGTDVDLETGNKTTSVSVTKIRKVIILPATIKREVIQSISQISANKAFVMGGYYDSATRMFIIDRKDARDLVLKEDDWFVFDGRKYEIKTIQEFEYDTAYVVIAKHQLGDVNELVFPLGVSHTLELTSVSTGEL